MKVHSIISNTISEDILATGHLSIRFMPDGFSLLLENRNFEPVILNKFSEPSGISLKSQILACEDWLSRHTLIDEFNGEISLVIDAVSATLVPKDLFSEEAPSVYLAPSAKLQSTDMVRHKQLKNRSAVLVYSLPAIITLLAEKFSGQVRIMSPTEVLISMAEQINAADHHRGFILAEIQKGILSLLIIQKDQFVLANQFRLKTQDNLVYHTLNVIQQLGFDRKKRPLFLAGQDFPEELKILRKYVHDVRLMPYHIRGIDKTFISEHMLLAEASKCE
jgi:hypothetical protein